MTKATRFKTLCHILSALLALVALWRMVGPAVIAVDPMLAGGAVQCTPDCRFERDPVRLLGEELWKQAWRIEGIEQRIADRVQLPSVRLLLLATALLRALPLFLLFISLAAALRSFAVSGITRQAVRWLKRATVASVLWTLARPVSDALHRRAMNAVVRGHEEHSLLVDVERLLVGLLIAGTAWVTIRIIEDALAMRDDLEDYV